MTDTPTPRADDFPRIGCIQHDCDACAKRAQEFAKLTADLAACRAALREQQRVLDGVLPLTRRVLRTVKDWNDDPDRGFAHPFTDLALTAQLSITARALVATQEGD